MHIPVGLITIFAIVLVPVYIFLIASFLGRPRALKVTILILGLPAALVAISIGFTWLLSFLMSFILP